MGIQELEPKTKTPQETKKEILGLLLMYKKDYNENIPNKAYSEKDPELHFYKYQPHFFRGILRLVLSLVYSKIITDPEVGARSKEFEIFVEKINEEKFLQNKPATKEDIDVANKFLDYMIVELQK